MIGGLILVTSLTMKLLRQIYDVIVYVVVMENFNL